MGKIRNGSRCWVEKELEQVGPKEIEWWMKEKLMKRWVKTITRQYFSSSVALILYYLFLKSCLRFSFLLDHKLANQLSVALLPCYSIWKQLLPFLLALLEKQINFCLIHFGKLISLTIKRHSLTTFDKALWLIPLNRGLWLYPPRQNKSPQVHQQCAWTTSTAGLVDTRDDWIAKNVFL